MVYVIDSSVTTGTQVYNISMNRWMDSLGNTIVLTFHDLSMNGNELWLYWNAYGDNYKNPLRPIVRRNCC